MQIEPAFILKTGSANKTGPRSTGALQYQIITNKQRSELLIMITGNDGGGYFSSEMVPFTAVVECLKGIKANDAFHAKTFKSAFKGKSSNNMGFMAAILRAEGLLSAAPESTSQHQQSGDWKGWMEETLKLSGEPYVPPALKETESITSNDIPKADAARAKRKGSKAHEDKQLPSSEGNGDADHPA